MPATDPCASLWNEYLALLKQIEQIQSSPTYIQGPPDDHPGRPNPSDLSQVKVLWNKVTTVLAQYDACRFEHGALHDLSATLKGTATLTTSNEHAAGPFEVSVAIGLFFPKYDHTPVSFSSFPPITVGPFSTPAGSNTTTITLVGNPQGSFDRSKGILSLPLSLHFDESNAFVANSNISITLSTEDAHPKGARLDAAGHITLAGTAVFQGGALGGDVGTLVLTGTISPHP